VALVGDGSLQPLRRLIFRLSLNGSIYPGFVPKTDSDEVPQCGNGKR
jgi:hypothetical protein